MRTTLPQYDQLPIVIRVDARRGLTLRDAPGGPIGKIVQKVTGTAAFAKVAPRVVTPLDKLVHRLTGGRRMLSKGGPVPTLMLTTTGARSGDPRPYLTISNK